ncbi:hypothetical protein MF672_021690 [Actinomadura sp. ATCC 31491]|uniref:Serine/threonine protein kinase n=1 Tax=Actinomadura luzonensis TaxID=2805427 RepID=A0ABT0FW51_9ACTN|nr:hypothetical protein [Actinomadura luzonensis]MCK2216393.1 hypothetical protein [Actinomadura luzonensis]
MHEDRATASGGPRGRGWSREAWIAFGTIVAALITGVVTLLTQTGRPGPNPAPTTPSAAGGAGGANGVDRLVGSWQGSARDGEGARFLVDLDVRPGCDLGRWCGYIAVSHVPCHGRIYLQKVVGDQYEFRVADFDATSDRKVCRPGAGELFRPQPDGGLAYRTSYDQAIHTTLRRK